MTISKQFGDLVLAFTDEFEFRWNDRESGGKYNGGFWHPIPPDGFYVLGSIGLPNYSDPNYDPNDPSTTQAALCVKAASNPAGGPPLKPPTSYELIWKDSGSGAKHDGSCWRPIPPDGYVALGDVFQKGYGAPTETSKVMCVRKDLTYDAQVGSFIWNDKDTGSNKDFGSWEIAVIPGYKGDPGVGSIEPHCFVGVASHSQPQTNPVLHVLYLPFPFAAPNPPPPPPQLTSSAEPPQSSPSSPVLDHEVFVPFTGITDTDPSWTVHRQVEESPFYRLQRLTDWLRVLWQSNPTNSPSQAGPATYSLGVNREQSESYSEETSVSVTETSGVTVGPEVAGTSAGSFQSSVSSTVTTTLGWASETAVGEMASVSVAFQQTVDPQQNLAEWVERYSVRLVRYDGKVVPVTQPLTFPSATVSTVSRYDLVTQATVSAA